MSSSMCLSCWGETIKSSTTIAEDAYKSWPPVKFYRDGHLDIEFGPLLLVDSLIMDRVAYDTLLSVKPCGLERAISSLKMLADEGYLTFETYGARLAPMKEQVIKATETRTKIAPDFVTDVRSAVLMWEGVSQHFSKVVGKPTDLKATLPIGILHCVLASGTRLNQRNSTHVRRALFKEKPTKDERQLVVEIARPYFEHVNTAIGLAKTLKVPVFDWADMGPIYKALLSVNLDQEPTIQQFIPKVRQLFEAAIPQFEPSSAKEFLAVVRDSRVADFRRAISDMVEQGVDPGPQIVADLAAAINDGRKSFGRAQLGATAAVTAISAFAGGMEANMAATMALGHLTLGAAHEAFLRFFDKRLNERAEWLFCLMDAKKVSAKSA